MNFLVRILKARWNLLRLLVAAFLLWALVADHAGRLARLQLAALPDTDFAAEIATLRDEGRFGEAVMLADAGLALTSDGPARDRIASERQKTLDEQSSWLRRLKDIGMGALSGRGESLEGLAGAVTTDLFIVGDVRDLLIQGSKFAIDGEADGVILALSGVGIATTLAPEIDWAVSLLKVGRKTGAMGKNLGEFVISASKKGDSAAVRRLIEDSATLAKKSSPGTALRALRACDTPEDAARLAAFLERSGPAGAYALHLAGGGTLDAIKAGTDAERALLKATKKGEAGLSWLRTGGRVLARPHPLIGLAKGLYKGNVEDLAARVAERLDPQGWWLTPLLAAWLVVEVGLLWRRMTQQ